MYGLTFKKSVFVKRRTLATASKNVASLLVGDAACDTVGYRAKIVSGQMNFIDVAIGTFAHDYSQLSNNHTKSSFSIDPIDLA